jgi:hypothetical protein
MEIYIILLLEGLAVHPKSFRGPPVDRDRRLAQGCATGIRKKFLNFTHSTHTIIDW